MEPERKSAPHSLVVRFKEFEASGNGWGIVAIVVIAVVLGGVAITYKLDLPTKEVAASSR